MLYVDCAGCHFHTDSCSVLNLLDNATNTKDGGLAAIARDHSAFISRDKEFSLAKLSPHEVTDLCFAVKQLSSQLSDRTLVKGDELLALSLDDLSIANLEHLLLCLLHLLIQALTSEGLEQSQTHQHLLDCQKDQSIHSEEWFFEFPNAQHPLSTTWPWSLRPSLAVLWGVCWMFYGRPVHLDSEGNVRDDRNEVVVPAYIVQLHRSFEQSGQTPAITGTRCPVSHSRYRLLVRRRLLVAGGLHEVRS